MAAAIVLRRLRRATAAALSSSSPLLRPLPPPPAVRLIPACAFRATPPALVVRRNDAFQDKEIGPDEILFEGCDYKHWLITMDFPKDPKPSAEEMVEAYVQTAAQVFGSVEEAKKRIYACSTTTYEGFQVEISEEMSEKFQGLPGVVFILPDSYIDPVNKQYGGDKYDNGVITPRPPPVQYRPQRPNDRNRNFNQPRFNAPQGQIPSQQGYQPRDRPPPMQDGRNSGPPPPNYGARPPNYGPPPPNYGAPPPNYGAPPPNYGAPPPNSGPPPPNYGAPPPNSGPPPPNYGAPPANSCPPPPNANSGPPPPNVNSGPPPPNYGPPQPNYGAPQQNYGPPQGQDGRAYGPPGGRDSPSSGDRRDYRQAGVRDFNQGQGGNYAPQEIRNFAQGPPGSGVHGQGGPPSSYTGDSVPGYGGEYSSGKTYPGPR